MTISNNEIKRIKSLQQKKFRDETELFIVEGEKMVEEALSSGFKVEAVYRKDEMHRDDILDIQDFDIVEYLWKVMLPLALPTLISITILKMMGAWNSYIWPRLVANDDAHRLITNGLRNAFTTTSGDVNIPVQMAAVALVSAPLFLVFLFLRKYIMAGVSRSGIKG